MNERIDILLSNFLKNSMPAHGLPAAAYNDSEFWEIESETVFTCNVSAVTSFCMIKHTI